MGIANFFDQSIVIRRQRSVGGDRISFQSTATSEGHIQALDAEARGALGIAEEKIWKAWFPVDVNLQEGDKITDEDGKEYRVREIVVKDYAFGINVHTEALIAEVT